MLLALQILIVLGAIVLGARLGSIAIGLPGPACWPSAHRRARTGADIPFDVIGIIMCVIAAISAMQRAGGMDYLVHLANASCAATPPDHFWAPVVTWLMTVLAGTGHTAFSTLPVIVEVAKEGGVRPSRPLSVAVIASQMAIVASPISAAVVFMASLLEPQGVSYLTLLAVMIPATFLAIFPTALLTNRMGPELADDPVYRERLASGLVRPPQGPGSWQSRPGARASVGIFLAAIVAVMLYATAISEQVGLITEPTLPRNEAIMTIMLAAATVIVLVARIPADEILRTQVFRSGMSAAICVLGVAWLGTTIINNYIDEIQVLAGDVLTARPWLLAVVLFFAAALLYSQAATAKALMPAALAIGVAPLTAVAAFPAVSALFILPTYPTLLAAVEMDDTGSTRIGRLVFNHPFLIPGTVNIILSVIIAYGLGALLI